MECAYVRAAVRQNARHAFGDQRRVCRLNRSVSHRRAPVFAKNVNSNQNTGRVFFWKSMYTYVTNAQPAG